MALATEPADPTLRFFFPSQIPSALENRPMTFEEWEELKAPRIYMSATPGDYELERSGKPVEQLIRPTGLLDPIVEVRKTSGQIDDLMEEIRNNIARNERTLVTTLTVKMAEDLSDYLKKLNFKVAYLHHETKTLERSEIIHDLRAGKYPVRRDKSEKPLSSFLSPC